MTKIYDVVIIGAGVGGLNAAMYSARGSLSVLLLDKKGYGGALNDTESIENYLGFSEVTGEELAESMFEQVEKYDSIDFKFDEVASIEKLEDETFKLASKKNTYLGKTVILATGVKHKKLGLDREEELEGKGISFCALCDGFFFKDKDIAVVGGGNSALEEAMYLADIVKSVTLVHRRDTFTADSIVQERIKKKDNVHIKYNYVVDEFIGSEKLEGLKVRNVITDREIDLEVSGLFEYIGVVPTSDVYTDLGILDSDGYIVTTDRMETEIDGLYAVGDIRQGSKRQIATAVGDGAIAGLEVRHYLEK